jgi:hypothetical protein
VVESLSWTGAPPATGTAQALNTPVSSLLTRIDCPSAEKPSPAGLDMP